MSDLPEKWRKGNLPEGWGKNHILSHSSVPEEHPKPPVKTVEAGRQTEDADNQVTEQQLEQERATVFEDISSSTQGSKIFTEDNNHSILVNAVEKENPIAEHRAKVTVDRPSPRHSASRVPSYQPIYSREPGKPRNIEESDIVTKKKSWVPRFLVTFFVAAFVVVGVILLTSLPGNLPVKEATQSAVPSSDMEESENSAGSTSQSDTSQSSEARQSSAQSNSEVPASSKPDITPSSELNSATNPPDTLESQATISSEQPSEPSPVYCSVCGADCTYQGLIDGMCEDCYEIYGQPYNEPNVYCPNCNYGFMVSGVGISGFECPQCHYKFFDPEDSYTQEFYDIAGYYEGYQILVNGEPHDIDSSDAQLTLYADGSVYFHYAGVDFHNRWDVGKIWDESAPSEIVYFDAANGQLTMYLPDDIEVLFSKIY